MAEVIILLLLSAIFLVFGRRRRTFNSHFSIFSRKGCRHNWGTGKVINIRGYRRRRRSKGGGEHETGPYGLHTFRK